MAHQPIDPKLREFLDDRPPRWPVRGMLLLILLVVVLGIVAVLALSGGSGAGEHYSQTAAQVEPDDLAATAQASTAIAHIYDQTATAQAGQLMQTAEAAAMTAEAGATLQSGLLPVQQTATALADLYQNQTKEAETGEPPTPPAASATPRLTATATPTMDQFYSEATAFAQQLTASAVSGPSATPIVPQVTFTPQTTFTQQFTFTPQPTYTAPSLTETFPPTPEPTEVVSLTVNLHGEHLGIGVLRLYAPNHITYPQQARIELELALAMPVAELTPAPGLDGWVSPQPIIGTPRPTATLRNLIDGRPDQPVYERMAAMLTCRTHAFDECTTLGIYQIQTINSRHVFHWVWQLTPKNDLSGPQALTVELWLPDEFRANGQDASTFEWRSDFDIEIIPGESSLVPTLLPTPHSSASSSGSSGDELNVTRLVTVSIAAGGIFALSLFLLFLFLSRLRWRPRPKVFISYRREGGWTTARMLHDRLSAMGARVFIDVDDINEGRFAEIIERAIINCDHFLAVLAPGTLDSEWVQREIASAIKYDKNIVPVLVGGFEFAKQLPASIAILSSHNAIKLEAEYFDAALERLARFIKLKK